MPSYGANFVGSAANSGAVTSLLPAPSPKNEKGICEKEFAKKKSESHCKLRYHLWHCQSGSARESVKSEMARGPAGRSSPDTSRPHRKSMLQLLSAGGSRCVRRARNAPSRRLPMTRPLVFRPASRHRRFWRTTDMPVVALGNKIVVHDPERTLVTVN